MTSHPLVLYLREMAALPRLSPNAMPQLIALAQNGGQDAEAAKKRLVEGHLLQVVSIANEYSQDPWHLLDLITEGNIGLFRSLDGLDRLRDATFSAHAATYIRQAIADASARQ